MDIWYHLTEYLDNSNNIEMMLTLERIILSSIDVSFVGTYCVVINKRIIFSQYDKTWFSFINPFSEMMFHDVHWPNPFQRFLLFQYFISKIVYMKADTPDEGLSNNPNNKDGYPYFSPRWGPLRLEVRCGRRTYGHLLRLNVNEDPILTLIYHQ